MQNTIQRRVSARCYLDPRPVLLLRALGNRLLTANPTCILIRSRASDQQPYPGSGSIFAGGKPPGTFPDYAPAILWSRLWIWVGLLDDQGGIDTP